MPQADDHLAGIPAIPYGRPITPPGFLRFLTARDCGADDHLAWRLGGSARTEWYLACSLTAPQWALALRGVNRYDFHKHGNSHNAVEVNMPVRHEGDFQRKQIQSWDSWIDEAIRDAQAQGEFDNLPDAGKPIRLEDTPFAPEMASALRTLKNAGYAPTWMEIDREITQGKEEMSVFLQRSAAYLQRKRHDILASEPQPEPVAQRLSWWARFKRMLSFAADFEAPVTHRMTLDDLLLVRASMRTQYLQLAAEVDKKTTAFHSALPRNLWHLERMRVPVDKAAEAFDRAVPLLG